MAAERLRALAKLAAGQPAPRGSGRFGYARTRGLHGATDSVVQADGSLRVVAERIEPAEREFWIARDGSGRIEETRAGQRTRTSRVYGPGELYGGGPVSTDPDELERLLAGRLHGRGTFEWFKAVRTVWSSRVVGPDLQAALLEVLARQPDLDWHGAVADPIGRPSVAVSTTTEYWSRPKKHTWYFGQETGMPLADRTEELGPNRREVASGFTAWLTWAYVETTDDRPDQPDQP